MTLKDMMLDYLKEEGFCPKEDEYGIDFKCEGRAYAFIYEENDDPNSVTWDAFELQHPDDYPSIETWQTLIWFSQSATDFSAFAL